ncbi:Lrp/AsnC family transcriptional regulator GigD [Acinetobacter rudis]|uniref:Lrp/AsnC family transcriptional regulator GigD n=1 Tax=Acinetobacter rudis TaxID=632955 RepID=A0AAW8JHM3_9GAMM|nr:Lrp/AsnC family transcriptional regulator GigD [Acinetobacter rudis]MDQ8937209.1 Lrp/AsnC family transcriptional regulator GigD [Acinetobacter rudis]MDQ9019420.1 Lrp/AsnC family transcriptional regulator GigD [Acinetobacter rudis]
MKFDAIDHKILKILQDNARLSNQEIADLVNLSSSACHRRIKLLESSGVIEKYKAKLNYAKMGIHIEAIVEIKLAQLTELDHKSFLSAIEQFEEVTKAYIITGESNYVLHVATKDLNAFSQFVIHKLNKVKGITNINSKIILEKVI